MARNFGTQTPTAGIALTAATRTAIARLTSPAFTYVALTGFDITFNGVVVTDTPTFIEILRITSDGVGMTTRNPLQTIVLATGLQTTGAVGPVSGGNLPTAGAILRTYFIHPQSGVTYPLLAKNEILFGDVQNRIAIFVTAPQAVSVTFVMTIEE